MKKRTMLTVGKRMFKTFNFSCKEVKQETVNGVPVGIIEGYASTWDVDRGDDIIQIGAFTKTLKELRGRNRTIRMLFGHAYDNIIGGFPVTDCFEDDKGLFVRGQINLEVQRGAEVYALAKQGILSDMSIGFSIPSMDAVEFREDGNRVLRVIKEVDLWEISIVPEPMNARANITAVKSAVSFQDLPLADREMAWDSDNALARIRSFTGSQDAPSATYKNAFLWYDADAPEQFGSYKLPIADVVDGVLKAVPRGIFAAAAAMQGARGGVDIPSGDRDGVVANIERYYGKMELPSPFSEERGIDVTFAESCQSLKDVEELLKYAGFSSAARNVLISIIKNSAARDGSGESGGDADDGQSPNVTEEVTQMVDKLKAFNGEFVAKTLLNQLKH